jgi:hypothetical protein
MISLAKPTDEYTYLTDRDDLWSYLLTHYPAEGGHLHRELRNNSLCALQRLLRHD